MNIGTATALLLGLAACSAQDPEPSPIHDGHYAGTRRSDRPEVCGIAQADGTTSARVVGGRISLPLFGPKTMLTGTVGDDGTVRASGMWPNPTGGFPGMTVLNGRIEENVLDGTASDFRCRTDVRLRKTPADRRRPAGRVERR
jgi:hypothetical protein